MARKDESTYRQRRQWARIWTAVRACWESTDDLADVLGACRSAVAMWCSDLQDEDQSGRVGPWHLLLLAARETARRHPEAAARLAEGLVGNLLDLRGRWVPAETSAVGDVRDELGDVTVAQGELTSALRRRAPHAEIVELSRALVVEAEQAERAALNRGTA